MENKYSSMNSSTNMEILNPEESEIISNFLALLLSGAKPSAILANATEHDISLMEYSSLEDMRAMMMQLQSNYKQVLAANEQLKSEIKSLLSPLAGAVYAIRPVLEDLGRESQDVEDEKLSILGQFLMSGASLVPQLKDTKPEEIEINIKRIQKLIPYLTTNMDAIMQNLSNMDWKSAIKVLVDRKVLPEDVFSEEQVKGLPVGNLKTID